MRIRHTYIIKPYQMVEVKWHWAFMTKGFSALTAYSDIIKLADAKTSHSPLTATYTVY